MTEDDLLMELERDPFVAFRLHLVSGKVIDVLAPNAAHTLATSLLVLRNAAPESPRADGYDVVAYANIERIEQLEMGKCKPTLKGPRRRPA